MDFNDTPEEAAYRAKARAWLEANAPRRKGAAESGLEDPANMDASRAWQRKKSDAGYTCITWPKEWGGGGGASWQASDRTSGSRRRAGLIQPGNWHSILRPAGHGAHGSLL